MVCRTEAISRYHVLRDILLVAVLAVISMLIWRNQLRAPFFPDAVSGALEPNAQWFAAINGPTRVLLHDTRTGAITRIITLRKDGSLRRLAFSEDGDFLAGATNQGLIMVWNTKSGKLQFTLTQAPRNVWSLSFSPDSRQLVTTGSQGVEIWNLPQQKRVYRLRQLRSSIRSAAFSPDGHFLGISSSAGEVKLLDVESKELQTVYNSPDAGVISLLAFSPDSKTLAVRTGLSRGYLIDLPTSTVRYTFPRPVLHLTFNHAGTVIATVERESGWQKALVRHYERKSMAATPLFGIESYVPSSLAFNRQDSYLVLAASSGRISRWRMATGELDTVWMCKDSVAVMRRWFLSSVLVVWIGVWWWCQRSRVAVVERRKKDANRGSMLILVAAANVLLHSAVVQSVLVKYPMRVDPLTVAVLMGICSGIVGVSIVIASLSVSKRTVRWVFVGYSVIITIGQGLTDVWLWVKYVQSA